MTPQEKLKEIKKWIDWKKKECVREDRDDYEDFLVARVEQLEQTLAGMVATIGVEETGMRLSDCFQRDAAKALETMP